MPEIVVHHLDHSRSQRVLCLLEELGLPYQVREYKRDRQLRAPAALREVHPLGKSPVVTVDGEVLAESGAIMEEILDRFGQGRLRPAAGTPEHRLYRYFLHYAEGSLMTPLLVKLITTNVRRAKVPFFVKPVAKGIAKNIDDAYTDPEVQRHHDFLEAHLAERPWFAGAEFTGADIQMSYGVWALLARGGETPGLRRWFDAIQARPAWERAISRGGPLDF